MPQLIFGKFGQIRFASDAEFFEALGFLTKNNGTTSIHWEHNENQGAWGSEGRIHCYKNLLSFPLYFSSAFTAGRGKVLHRINCNQYIEYLANHHAIVRDSHVQDEVAIRATVPAGHMPDFDRGLTL